MLSAKAGTGESRINHVIVPGDKGWGNRELFMGMGGGREPDCIANTQLHLKYKCRISDVEELEDRPTRIFQFASGKWNRGGEMICAKPHRKAKSQNQM